MFCPKCHYTSFDHLTKCPKCNYEWSEEKRKLNIEWLVIPSTKDTENKDTIPQTKLSLLDFKQEDFDKKTKFRSETKDSDSQKSASKSLNKEVYLPNTSNNPQPAQSEKTIAEDGSKPNKDYQDLSLTNKDAAEDFENEEISFPDLEGLLFAEEDNKDHKDDSQDRSSPKKQDESEEIEIDLSSLLDVIDKKSKKD